MGNPSSPDKLFRNEEIFAFPDPAQNQTDLLVSHNGTFQLILQEDGNLVLYIADSEAQLNRPIWASGTQNQPSDHCIMQDDGNLVIYDNAGNPLWNSGTQGNPGAFLFVQDDGNTVIYTGDGETALKWTDTAAGEPQSGNVFQPLQGPG